MASQSPSFELIKLQISSFKPHTRVPTPPHPPNLPLASARTRAARPRFPNSAAGTPHVELSARLLVPARQPHFQRGPSGQGPGHTGAAGAAGPALLRDQN